MNIVCVTSDPFFSQELVMQLSPSDHKLDLYTNGLTALSSVTESPPDIILIDNECESINSVILINLISRDSKFSRTEIHYLSNRISDPESFKKQHEVKKIWQKPLNATSIINYLK